MENSLPPDAVSTKPGKKDAISDLVVNYWPVIGFITVHLVSSVWWASNLTSEVSKIRDLKALIIAEQERCSRNHQLLVTHTEELKLLREEQRSIRGEFIHLDEATSKAREGNAEDLERMLNSFRDSLSTKLENTEYRIKEWVREYIEQKSR